MDVFTSNNILQNHLKSINNVKFSNKEIDVLAYLLSGRSSKKIASLLSSSPRTVETHIRNIMQRLECNSREEIIDFIEKSGKLSAIKQYYLNLVIKDKFEKKLNEISKLSDKKFQVCIVYDKNLKSEEKTFFIHQFEKYLKLSGIDVVIQKGKNFNASNHMSAKIVHFISEAKMDSFNNQNNFISILLADEISSNLNKLQDRKDLITLCKQKNYYLKFFELLKRVQSHINIDKIVKEFEDYYFTMSTSLKIHSPQDKENIEKFQKNHAEIYNYFIRFKKNKKYKYVILTSLTAIFLSIILWIKEHNQNYVQPIRSELIIPMEDNILERTKLIGEIKAKFNKKSNIQTLAIIGIGGAGKTTIARQYARSQDVPVIWEINAETHASLITSFENLALALSITENEKKIIKNLSEIKDHKEREITLFSFIQSHLKKHPDWLLIFDNVETFSDIQSYFPYDYHTWGRGKILLTTRDRNIQNHSSINNAIHIDELTPQEKEQLFFKIMETDINVKQNERVKKFLIQLPPFPLDISVAAYYIKATNISYDQYLENLNQHNQDFTDLQKDILKSSNEYSKTRYDIVGMSMQMLIEADKDFSELLLLISLMDSQNIPRDLLDNYKSKATTDKFIYHLKKYSLILNTEAADTFSIHRSTQAISLTYLRQVIKLEKIDQALKSINDALSNYLKTIIEEENFRKSKILIRHIETFLNHDGLDDILKATIAGELGCIYFLLNNYPKARKIFEETLKILNKNQNNYKKIARFSTYLGYTYRELNNYPEGKKLLERALLIYKEFLPKNHTDIACCLKYLGMLHRGLGDLGKAKDFLEKSLTIYEKSFPKNYAAIAWVLTSLGCVCREMADYEKAKELLTQSIIIYKKYFLGNNSGVAWSLAHLGSTFHHQGNYRKAKELFEECLETTEFYFPENHVRVAWVLVHLAKIHEKLGNYNISKNLLEQSLIIYSKNFPKTHLRISWVSMNLGCIYEKLGNYEQSRKIFENGLTIYKKYYPEHYDDISWGLTHLGNIYQKLGYYEKARELLAESLFIYKNHTPSNQIRVSWILLGLGNVFYKLNNSEKSKILLEESLIIYSKHYGKDHIKTAQVLRDLGQVYFFRNCEEIADNLLNKSLQIFQKNNHPESFTCLENLAELYIKKSTKTMNKGDVQQSLKFKKKAIHYLNLASKIVSNHFLNNSPHIIRIQEKLKSLV